MDLIWYCPWGVQACNPLTKDKFSLEHTGCRWIQDQGVIVTGKGLVIDDPDYEDD